MSSTRLLAGIAIFALALPTGAPAVAEVPPRTTSGTTLVVPESHAVLGRVYYVRYPSETGQITFTSDAPIEIIVGTSNRVVGYAVVEERDGAPTGQIVAGGFRLPVRSLDSGIPLRNEHMQQGNFFDAAQYPDITFEMTGARGVEEVEAGDGSTTYAMTLLGDLTIRDVTRPMEIASRVTLMPGSDMTRNAGPGDVMALRCSYTVKRTEFGVAPRFMNSELVDEIKLDQRLILTTTSFDDRLRAARDPEKEMRLQRVVSLIRDRRDLDAAVECGRQIMADYPDDFQALNTLAWNAATTAGTNVRRFSYLTEAAERAGELSGGAEADVLDTIARVHYELGDLTAAVRWQRKAVEHRKTASDPSGVVSTLHDYEHEAGVTLTEVPEEKVADLPQGTDLIGKYAGTFKIEARGFELTCVDKDGRLHLQPPGGQLPAELLFQGNHEFRLADEPAIKLVFHVEDGRALGFAFHQGPRVMEAVRVEPGS